MQFRVSLICGVRCPCFTREPFTLADWVCQVNCRAPRCLLDDPDVPTWELSDTVNVHANTHPDEFAAAVVFEPHFRVPGIDRLYLREYTEARDRVLALAADPSARGREW